MAGEQHPPGSAWNGGGGREASAPDASLRDGDDLGTPPGPHNRALEERWRPEATEHVGDFEVFRVRRDRICHPMHGGVLHFHAVDVPPGVMVVPLTEDGAVVMVEQYRHAVRRVSLEFPAGMIDGDEEPEEAGPRELEEETGFQATSFSRLATLDPDPSLQSNSTAILLARGCRPTGMRDQDEGEDVQVRLVPEAHVSELIRTGMIRHAMAVAAWALYHAERSGGRTPPGAVP